MTTNPYKLSQKFIFLGEGRADNALMRKFSEKRALPAFDYPFPEHLRKNGKDLGGKDQFGEMLLRIAPFCKTKIPARGIVIAVDCGNDWKKSFGDVANLVTKTELYPCPEAPLEAVSANTKQFPYLPRLVIVMVPGVGKTGGMETLCVEALRAKHTKTAECLDQYLACLTKKGVGIESEDWGAEKRSKAEMQCLIAVTNREDPNKSGRYVFSKQNNGKNPPVIDVSHKAFDPLAQNLKNAIAAL